MQHNSDERAANMRAHAGRLRDQAKRAAPGDGFFLIAEAVGWEDTAEEALGNRQEGTPDAR